jgi:hypothetical protein
MVRAGGGEFGGEAGNDEGFGPVDGALDAGSLARRRIIELQVEHRDLDRAIARLSEIGAPDELQLRRLKKRKLQIKDAINQLEMGLVPDIPA